MLPLSLVGGLAALASLDPATEIAEPESPQDARSHYKSQEVPLLSSRDIAHLRETGYAVVDLAIDVETLAIARRDALACCFERTKQHADDVRTDSVFWIRENAEVGQSSTGVGGDGLQSAHQKLRTVAHCLESRGWDGFDVKQSTNWIGHFGVPRFSQLANFSSSSHRRHSAQEPAVNDAEESEQQPWVVRVGLLPAPRPPPFKAPEAWEDGSSRYRAHRDTKSVAWHDVVGLLQGVGTNARQVTAVLYLSDPSDWQADETLQPKVSEGQREEQRVDSGRIHENELGGELVLYLGADADDDTGASATTVLKIAPVGGRLVVFDSASVLHEVMPHTCERPRIALTCWIGGRHSNLKIVGFLRRCGLTQ
jgi:hypothetical protein